MNSSLPMPVKGRPFLHQQEAFDFVCGLFGLIPGGIKSAGAAILAEMGTGKTYIMVAVIGILYQFGLVNRALIVAPLSLLGVWEEELIRFADYPLNITVLKGTSAKKKEQLSVIPDKGLQIVIVNYESAWRLEEELLRFRADIICADEGHKIKEGRTSQAKTMHKLADHAKYRCLLTGTLISNRELDVHSQYKFVNKDIFGSSFYQFRNRYFDMGGYGGYVPIFRKSMTEEFIQKLHSIAFRITKAECLDLPAITDEVRHVELEPKAMKIYKELEKESYTEIAGGEVSAPNVLTKILRLSQVAGGYITDDGGNLINVSKAKMEMLEDIIESSVAEGKKIVVMARFVAELKDIEAMLIKKKIGFSRIRGGVTDRDEQIHRFQNDDDCMVFVGNIAAAGLGITLTAASTMVFYSLDYNMANYEQAKARIHRVSQKENCHYIYLVGKGTIDSKVLYALRHKVDLAKLLVDECRNGIKPSVE